MDVMFYEVFEEEEKGIRQFLPSDICAQFTWKTIQEQLEKSPPAEFISVRTQSRIPLGWARGLKGILTRSQGYDHLLTFHRECGKDVACGYLNDYCARAVAEQAILMMMALLRKLKKQTINFDRFIRDGLTGRECRNRNALVVGVGCIGREIVDIIKGLRMLAKGVDIAPTTEDIDYVLLDEGLVWADIVFCALPLTEKTKGMLNYDVLQKVKPGGVFINISRGEISPVEDLKRLLSEGIFGGIGLDVFSEEAEFADCLRAGRKMESLSGQAILDLARDNRVLLTPHNAFNTEEALKRKVSLSVAAVTTFFRKGIFQNPIPLE